MPYPTEIASTKGFLERRYPSKAGEARYVFLVDVTFLERNGRSVHVHSLRAPVAFTIEFEEN